MVFAILKVILLMALLDYLLALLDDLRLYHMATMVLYVLHFVEGSQLLVLLLQISHLFLLFILALVFSKLFQDGLALHINSAR